ncbi:MAG: hypothetical protein Q4G10_03675 [Bacteroidia bacterium]|nr:hypothetical protein [Bacteroidia bacterium]
MEDNEYTLEQMRADYQALKDNFSKQEIINDRLLREAMKSKVRNVRSKLIISIACGVFTILASPFVFHYNPVINASWWFIAGTIILMGLCIFLDLKYKNKMQGSDLSHCDLLTFAKEVKATKDHYKNWTKWGIILGTAWAAWLCIEVWCHSTEPELAIGTIIALAAGLIIGGSVGTLMNKSIIRNCEDIIDQIES